MNQTISFAMGGFVSGIPPTHPPISSYARGG